MNISDNVAALVQMNERVNAHDVDFADDLYAPDVEWWYAGMAAPEHGLDKVKARDRATLAAFPDVHREIEQIVAGEKAVAVRWRLTATHHGEYGGFSATGKRVEFTGCSIFDFENDRVVRLSVYVDTATLMRQLG